MNIQIVELGLVGRETKGHEDPTSPALESIPKNLFRTEDDDEAV